MVTFLYHNEKHLGCYDQVVYLKATVLSGRLFFAFTILHSNLTNDMLKQGPKRYRLISSIGKIADSFKRALTDKSEILELPELIPLESYKYE